MRRGVELGELGGELLHHHGGIVSRLAHLLGPAPLQRLGPRLSGPDLGAAYPIHLTARIVMPLMSSGSTIFVVRECNVPGSWAKASQNLTSFIALSAYFRYQASIACEPPLASANRNGSSPAHMIGKRPG